MLQCTKPDGLEPSLLTSALEKNYKKFKNHNIDVERRCNNNRLLYLLPNRHHSDHMTKLLKDSWLSDGSEGGTNDGVV